MDLALWSLAGVLGVVGAWVVWRALFADRARGRRRCRGCWYDLAGAGEASRERPVVCPECGRGFTTARQMLRTRRRWGWAALGGVALMGAAATAGAPTVRAHGWWAVVPGPVLYTLWTTDLGKGYFSNNLKIEAELLYRRGMNGKLSSVSRRMIATRAIRTIETSTEPWDRYRALMMLGCFGVTEPRSVPALLAAVEHQDAGVRQLAVQVASGCFISPEKFVPVLIARLEDPSEVPEVRAAVADALAVYRSHARPAESALRRLLTDENERARLAAAYALGRMGAPASEVLPLVITAQGRLTSAELRAVAAFRDGGGWLAPRLIPLLDGSGTIAEGDARAVLAGLGPESAPAVEQLRANAAARPGTTEALLDSLAADTIDGVYPSYAHALLANLTAPDADSVWMVWRVNWLAPGPELLPELIRALDTPDTNAVAMIQFALASMGRSAEPALPKLRRMARALPPMGRPRSAIHAIERSEWGVRE